MTTSQSQPSGPSTEQKEPWHKRMPPTRRFVLWNLFCWIFGASALVGGILYTEHVVKPVAEGGGTSFMPTEVFKKESTAQRVFGNSDRMNILILGIDYNYDDKGIIYTKGARSDTMMVMSLSRDAKFLNVVSIPRDTQVFLGEDYGYDKINAAYSYGGVDQAKKVVSDFLGVPIHHHLVVKVSGAKKLIDEIGGLPIDVEKDLDYDDNWGKLHIHLKKGPQVLDGEQAVGYARFRMDEEGDRGRIRRQQQVIKALGSKLKEPALIAQLNGIAQVVKETLDTDLKPLEMVDLATLYGSFDFKNMRSGAIVGDDAMDANGVSYILPYAPENERTVRRLLKSLDWVTKGDLRVRIVFKGASPEIAYRLADRLADSGFDGVQVEALSLQDPRDTSSTYLLWYNRVTRLEGILRTITGTLPERAEAQPAGRDDDLVIVVGDHEKGEWAEAGSWRGTKSPR
jgi:LCP family protein required for cell wall assembly